MKKSLLVLLMLNVIGMTRADVVPGKVYRISSAANDKRALFVENSSYDNNASVVLWTDADVPSQQWEAKDNGDGTLSFINVLTGKYMARSSVSVGASTKLQQNTSASSKSKWSVQAAGGGSNRYILNQTYNSKNYRLTTSASSDGDNASLSEQATTAAITTQQTWIIEEVTPLGEFNAEIRTRMIDAWINKHMRDRGTNKKSFGNGGGWGDAEMLETLLDAYETTGKEEYFNAFTQAFNFFKDCMGSDWCRLRYDDTYKWYGHDFNDDVMWMIIAAVRAYHLTGISTYRTEAKSNFDKIYDRAFNKWGMMRWAQQSGGVNGTNSCINGPTEVAACYLAMAYKGENENYYNEYFDIARNLYENQRRYLFNAQTGEVFDSFTWDEKTNLPGGYNRWVSTYNQGTMLGAAVMLYNRFGDERYKKDAEKIVEKSTKGLCNANGIIKVCQTVDGDLCGFKGILMRYVRKYVVDLRHTEDVDWMKNNALLAYSNRNSYGVTASAWLTKSAENWTSPTEKDGNGNLKNFENQPFGNSTAVSAAANTPLDAEKIVKDAYSSIPATDFDYIRGIFVTDGTGGAAKEISNIRNKYYTGYSNVDFGSKPARSIQVKMTNGTASNQKIEIREGDYNGTLLGTITVPTSGGWQTVTANITPTDGMHDIYLVYRASISAKNIFKVAEFTFSSTTQPLPGDLTDNLGTTESSIDADNIGNLTDNRATTAMTINAQKARFTFTSAMPATLRGYAVVSNIDNSSNDPKAWTLYGSNDGEVWTTIDTRSNMTFNNRCEAKNFEIKADKAYTRFKLDVTGNNGGTMLSIGDWQLFGTAIAYNDITADGGKMATGDAIVIDKNTATAVNVNAGESAEFVYNSRGMYDLTCYSITAVNAADAPSSWTLYGKKGTEWEVIDRQTRQRFAYDGCTQFYKTQPTDKYQYFRLVTDAQDTKTEIAEVQLFGDVAADGTLYNNITNNGGTLSTSDGVNESVARGLIDNNAATSYRLPFNGTAWIQYQTEIPARLSSYRIISGYDSSRNPKKWTLEGSNNGTQWTTLSTVSNGSFTKKGAVKNTTVTNTNTYKYFRLTINAASTDDATEIEIGELQLHGICLATDDIISKGGTTTAEMPGKSDNESKDKLFDHSADSKYCFDYYGSAWVAFEANTATKANMYSITSANDNNGRDPKSWELQGSDNGTDWVTLDKREGEMFIGFKTTQFYFFNNEKAYKHYRLQILETRNDLMSQFSEWQLFYNSKVLTGITNTVAAEGMNISYDKSTATINVALTDKGTVTIYNANGQVVATHTVQAGQNAIPADALTRGLYIVKAVSDGKTLSSKFVK